MTVAATISPATPTVRQSATVSVTGLIASTAYLVVIGDPDGTHSVENLTSDVSGAITISNYTPAACGTGTVQVFNPSPTATFGPTTATVIPAN